MTPAEHLKKAEAILDHLEDFSIGQYSANAALVATTHVQLALAKVAMLTASPDENDAWTWELH